jgi:SMODS and SLOG-associating 2TM effector domain 1/SMODS and SLOG-associating 2TM effector domain 3
MATPPTIGMNSAWGFYRQCAATATFQKSQMEMFTRLSLWLGITGAVIGTLTQFVAPIPTSPASKVLGVIASLVVALAGLAATQAISGNRDKVWIKCRAAAEALKSALYLYSASVPPFDDGTRAVRLGELVEKTTKDLSGIELRPGTEKQPPGPLTVDGYIRDRLDDQVKFYNDTSNRFQAKADFWRNCTLAAAALAVALGTVSAITSLSPWVALLAILTSSVTAYVKNQRYETMIGLYQMTAIRLRALKDQWLDSGKTDSDKAERDSFIRRCEDTLSLENGAWVAQWTQTPPQLPPPAPPAPKGDG